MNINSLKVTIRLFFLNIIYPLQKFKKMKLSFLVVCVLFTIYSVAAQKNNAEQQAIRKVIDQETKAYFENKYENWADTWVHDSTTFRMNISPTGIDKTTGWDKLNKGLKEYMQTATPLNEENMSAYTNKFDYEYYISGSMATVLFKEGKTKETATDQMRLMVKQNGAWKIAGLTTISAANYRFKNSVEILRPYLGKWRMLNASFKNEPGDSAYKMISFIADIHETMNGFESTTTNIYSYSGNRSVITEREQFIPDYDINKFRYYDETKSSNGYITGGAGTAVFDSSGNFVISIMYDNKSIVKLKNIYSMKSDNTIRVQGLFFNEDGKQTNSWSFDMERM